MTVHTISFNDYQALSLADKFALVRSELVKAKTFTKGQDALIACLVQYEYSEYTANIAEEMGKSTRSIASTVTGLNGKSYDLYNEVMIDRDVDYNGDSSIRLDRDVLESALCWDTMVDYGYLINPETETETETLIFERFNDYYSQAQVTPAVHVGLGGGVYSVHDKRQSRQGVLFTSSDLEDVKAYLKGMQAPAPIDSITWGSKTVNKISRIGQLPWGDLFPMTADQVHEALTSLTNIQEIKVLDHFADWACLNQPSMTFDFPEEDRLKALLGALRWGYVTVE